MRLVVVRAGPKPYTLPRIPLLHRSDSGGLVYPQLQPYHSRRNPSRLPNHSPGGANNRLHGWLGIYMTTAPHPHCFLLCRQSPFFRFPYCYNHSPAINFVSPSLIHCLIRNLDKRRYPVSQTILLTIVSALSITCQTWVGCSRAFSLRPPCWRLPSQKAVLSNLAIRNLRYLELWATPSNQLDQPLDQLSMLLTQPLGRLLRRSSMESSKLWTLPSKVWPTS
jgi:hypothetical protein